MMSLEDGGGVAACGHLPHSVVVGFRCCFSAGHLPAHDLRELFAGTIKTRQPDPFFGTFDSFEHNDAEKNIIEH